MTPDACSMGSKYGWLSCLGHLWIFHTSTNNERSLRHHYSPLQLPVDSSSLSCHSSSGAAASGVAWRLFPPGSRRSPRACSFLAPPCGSASRSLAGPLPRQAIKLYTALMPHYSLQKWVVPQTTIFLNVSLISLKSRNV